MRTSWLSLCLVGTIVSVGCGRHRGGDDDGDGDADADADADGDGDADPPECTLGCPAGYECAVGVCEGGDAADLTLDLPTVTVSGHVTMNGARPATGPDCAECPDCSKASVTFTSDEGTSVGATIPCSSTDYAFDLVLPPGTYAVAVAGFGTSYAALPPGTAGVDDAFTLDADAAGVTFDVSAVSVSGNVTMNGARPGTGPDCSECPDCSKASVRFASEGGSSFAATIPCSASTYAFDLEMPPGTYAVSVDGYGTSYSALPPGNAVIDESFEVDGDAAGVTFDVPSVTVSGNVTMNGARPGTGPDCAECPDCSKASVSFRSQGGSSFAATIPCSSAAYAFDMDLPPGDYAVHVDGYGEAYSALPPGTAVVDASYGLDGDAAGVTFDVPTVSLSGNVTMNGARPGTGPDCGQCPDCSKARVSFTSEEGSAFGATILCSSSAYAFVIALPPDTYAVSVDGYGEAYAALPPGTAVVDTSFAVDADAAGLSFDVPTVAVHGAVTMNGARPGTGPDCGQCPDCSKASVSFTSEAGSSFGATIPCSASDYAFDLDLPPDTYAVSVDGYGEPYSALPPGRATLVRALQVP